MLPRPSDDLISDMFRRMHKAASGTVIVTLLVGAGTHRGQWGLGVDTVSFGVVLPWNRSTRKIA